MKVQLVQGYLGPMPANSLVYPLGLAYVGAALRADGHQVSASDPNAHPVGLDHLRDELETAAPEVVGISLRNLDTCDYLNFVYYYQFLHDTLQTIRQACPTASLIIGGAGFSMFPERIMTDHPEIDFGVFLEGEATIVDLLHRLDRPAEVPGLYYRDGDQVRFTGPRQFLDITEVDRPDHDLLDLGPYLQQERGIGIQSYRGCPLGCVYCNIPALNGRKVRCRSANDVVDEIERLQHRYAVSTVAFTDSVFDLDRGFAASVCEQLIARGVDIRWKAYFETFRFDEEWFLLARRAGCDGFFFSPDGATDTTMRALGKRCRERDLAEVLRLAVKYPETTFHIALFCGVPGQDWRDVRRLIQLIYQTHYRLRNTMCFLNWMRVLPATGAYRRLADSGALTADVDLLPASVTDHRQLFFVAPGLPRLATPVVLTVYRVLDRLRRRRQQAVSSAGQSR